MSKYNPERFQEWYKKNRDRLLPIRKKYNKDYSARPEVIEKAKIKNATPEAKAKRKLYKKTEAGKAYQRKYNKTTQRVVYVRNRHLKERYGITLEQYTGMFAQREGLCDICKLKFAQLHIDHSHLTGEVRGLICGSCNRGLGLFKDNTDLLKEAISYLKK